MENPPFEPVAYRPDMLAQAVVLQMESGRVHVRGPQQARARAAGLLLPLDADVNVDFSSSDQLDECGRVTDVWFEAEASTVGGLSSYLDRHPHLRVAGYEAVYDTHTPGPTVRYRRVHCPSDAIPVRPWTHIIMFAGEGAWVFGEEAHLRRVAQVARSVGLDVFREEDNDGCLHALLLEAEGAGVTLLDELDRRGFAHAHDYFG